MRSLIFIILSSLIIFTLTSCGQSQEIKMYYMSEVYSRPENRQQISLVNISEEVDNKVIYELDCYFDDELFANSFTLKEFWFFKNSGTSDDYYIIGEQYTYDFAAANMKYTINNEPYKNLNEFNFDTEVDYTILIEIDYYELSQLFDFDIDSQQPLESTIVRFMISSGETVFFTNMEENEK